MNVYEWGLLVTLLVFLLRLFYVVYASRGETQEGIQRTSQPQQMAPSRVEDEVTRPWHLSGPRREAARACALAGPGTISTEGGKVRRHALEARPQPHN